MYKKETYLASDWKEFNDEKECKIYETSLMPEIIKHTAYLYDEKWGVYNSLKEEGIYFDEDNIDNRKLLKLKYILNEIAVNILFNRKTADYEVESVEINWEIYKK